MMKVVANARHSFGRPELAGCGGALIISYLLAKGVTYVAWVLKLGVQVIQGHKHSLPFLEVVGPSFSISG